MLKKKHRLFIEQMSDREHEVLKFVIEAHGGQIRKYTGDPYWHHPVKVAYIANQYERFPLLTERALLHDVVEDTDMSYFHIMVMLRRAGYSGEETRVIIDGVKDLTDVYTSQNHPELNRKQRKSLEAERLSSIHPENKLIKMADLDHNTKSIVKHDPKFALTYMVEKNDILQQIGEVNTTLKLKLCYAISKFFHEVSTGVIIIDKK